MTEKANLDQVCEALARTMKVLRDILDRPRNCAHKCNCMARNSSMISKELEFALIAGKSALILAADDAGTDSIAGDKCRKLATVIQDHINALSTPPAPDAVKRYVNDGDLLPDGRTYVLASDYDSLARQVAGLREALKGLYDDQVDYLTINKLGGMDNHWMVRARKELGL